MTPAQLIASARELVGDFLPDTCTVKSKSAGSNDGYGGEAEDFDDVATDVPCLYESQSDSTLVVIGGSQSGVTRHKLFLKLDEAVVHDIGPGWEIVVDARDDKPALTFEDPRRLDESNEVLLTISAKLRQ